MAAPARYISRPYDGPEDLREMVDLISRRPADQIAAYPSIEDLREISGTEAGRVTIRVWENAYGKTAGFTLLDGAFLAFEAPSGEEFQNLARQMVAWAVEAATSGENASEQPEVLVTGCRDSDTVRAAFLEQEGFTVQPVGTLHFRRSLSDPVPFVRLPESFIIRPLAGESEVDDWLDVHHAAHGTLNMSADFRLAMMRAEEYRPELDLVAATRDGRLVAYVMCHFSEEENRLRGMKIGYTDPVATHPDFQGLGLARALLYAGFQRLRDAGMEYAEVSTWGENNAMIRAAESAGYRHFSTTFFYDRILRRG